MEITGKTLQLGIIGDPVEHSFSPKMHNFISSYMGEDYTYSAFHVTKNNLDDAIKGIRAMNIRGINVTSPHKIEVMKYLDEISTQAKLLGSVNTVVNNNGKLCGYNTDGEGFYTSLIKEGVQVKGKKVLIIGCGGVTKPTIIRLVQAGTESITLLNRTVEKAEKIAEDVFNKTSFKVQTKPENLDFDIVINTTTAGMEPQLDSLPVDMIEGLNNLDFITENTTVVDMIYNPNQTRFLYEAKKRGAKTFNGLGMLIYQGIIAYELFTGVKLPDNMADLIKEEVFSLK